MPPIIHKIRIRTDRWGKSLTLPQLEAVVAQINDRAQGRRMIGQIDGGSYDGKMRLAYASHVVLPTARIRGSSILVDVELMTDNAPGRTVAAFIKAGLQTSGTLRGLGPRPGGILVTSIDIDQSTTNPEETVLDDIVEALEVSDN